MGASDLFRDYLETAVEPTEVLTEVRIPAYDGWGFGYQKFNRRSEDWAMVAVSALVKKNGDTTRTSGWASPTWRSVPLRGDGGRGGAARPAGDAPIRSPGPPSRPAEGTDPPADLNASSDYKRHLARVLSRRALETAAGWVIAGSAPAASNPRGPAMMAV